MADDEQEEAHGAEEAHGEFDPIHHSADGYYLDFEPFGEVQLPRIFFVRRGDGGFGFDVYSSTEAALHSGEYRVTDVEEVGGLAGLEDAPAVSEDATEEIEGSEEAHAGAADEEETHAEAGLAPADGGTILIDFSITRHLVFAFLAALIVSLLFISLARRYERGTGRTSAPKGIFQNLFETLVIFVRDEIAKPNLGDKYLQFLPYLLTAFFFILTCNLLGLVPFGATATSNLMVTAVLALFTFVVTQVFASKDHWKHVFWPPGVPTLIKPILIPVEFLGLFTKPFALAIRLFANLTAGHLVILSLIGLIFSFRNLFGDGVGWGVAPVSVAFALFIYLLEILVALIQAYIFTMLSALFIGMAVEEHEHEHAHEPHVDELTDDHSHVTPHPLTGNGTADREPRMAQPEPIPAPG
ncbi:MAG: F0F1 ATP synthase subunit A [Rhodothermales bacterium]